MDLRPGDIVFERSPGWIGRVVRWATRGRHEPETKVNHVGLIVSTEGPEGPEVIEALWRVVRRPLARMEGEIEVWSDDWVGTHPREDIVAQALSYVGRPYGWWKIGAHLVDALLTKITGLEIYLARMSLRMDKYPICSWVVAWAYWRGHSRYRFGVSPQVATPDDIYDFVTKPHCMGWTMVLMREAQA